MSILLLVLLAPVLFIGYLCMQPPKECFICGKRLNNRGYVRFNKHHAVCSCECCEQYSYKYFSDKE
jgi:hypothetical protein